MTKETEERKETALRLSSQYLLTLIIKMQPKNHLQDECHQSFGKYPRWALTRWVVEESAIRTSIRGRDTGDLLHLASLSSTGSSAADFSVSLNIWILMSERRVLSCSVPSHPIPATNHKRNGKFKKFKQNKSSIWNEMNGSSCSSFPASNCIVSEYNSFVQSVPNP